MSSSSTESRPHGASIGRPVLGGVRPVSALWWPADWHAEAERRAEVLRHWSAGATLHRFHDGVLLQLPVPVMRDCDQLSAWALQRVAGSLCSGDLDARDLSGLPVADGWLVEGGQLRALRFADARVEQVSAWIDADVQRLQPFDLRLPEPERALVVENARLVHEVLGPAVPQSLAPDAKALLDAMSGKPAPAASARGTSPGGAAGAGWGGWGGRVPRLLRRVDRWSLLLLMLALGLGLLDERFGNLSGVQVILSLVLLRRVFLSPSAGSTATPAGGAPAGGARAGAGAGAGVAGWLRDRLQRSPVIPQRWRQWVARAAVTSGLSRMLGARHSAYMRRMLQMFDEGELDEALRHALPIGGDEGSLGQAFSAPGRRDDLSVTTRRGPSSSIGLRPDLENHLRQLYRRVAAQLESQGRIDEAVFTFAELLGERHQALELLERHERFAQAAELAFGWDMPAATIVRLHALAGDWRRAELIARRDHAFAEAVALLERRWPEAAGRLRTQWAESLAQTGRLLDAVRTAWQHGPRERVAEWVDLAEAAGGVVATRALAWRALGWPESLASREPMIRALQSDVALASERGALATELLVLPGASNGAVRRLALLIAGATLADQAGPAACLSPPQLKQLLQLTEDGGLKADVPPLGAGAFGKAPAPLARQSGVLDGLVPQPGLRPIVDAVCLSGQELLLAFGESGAVRVDASGRQVAHFAVPAERLVIADDGCSALALARRDDVWRVTRLDLMHRRAVDLGLHAFDAFADRFDGIGWTVGIGRKVQVLDVHGPGLREVLWQVADLPAPVRRIERGDQQETWLLADGDGVHQWSYALPQRRLKYRDPVPKRAEGAASRFVAGERGLLVFEEAAPGRFSLNSDLSGERLGDFELAVDDLPTSDGKWVALTRALAAEDAAGAPSHRVRLCLASGQEKVRWHWPADAKPQLRCHGEHWLLFDDLGRVATLNVGTGVQAAHSSKVGVTR